MTRWMKRWGWIGGLVFLAIPAMAATLTGKFGSFSSTVSSISVAPDIIVADGRHTLVVYIATSGTTIGTTSAKCQQSMDQSTWADVGSPASAVGVICTVSNPIGFYRVNVTTCTGCTLSLAYRTASWQ